MNLPIPNIQLFSPQSIIFILVFILALIYAFLKFSPGSRRKCDLVALVINDKERKIEARCLDKLAHNVYVDSKNPAFLVLLRNTKTYKFKKYSAVLAYQGDLLLLPLDPAELSTISRLYASEEHLGMTQEEIEKMLSKLYSLQDKITGHIAITPRTKVAFTFDVKKIIRNSLDSVLSNASEALIHILQILRRGEIYERLVSSLAAYQTAKYSWMKYIIYAVLVIGIVAYILMYASHGGAVHP